MYEHKEGSYFSMVRQDVASLLPAKCGRVLEIGCGSGGTLGWLKRSGAASHTTGVELCPGPAAKARWHADRVIEADADADAALDEMGSEQFDTVLALDVLEHLPDPWSTVKRIRKLVRPGGNLLVSLPNVRHYSVVLPLLFRGSWRYSDAGILDRTHLRFFSRDGVLDLLTSNGFSIRATLDNGLERTRLRESWKSLLALTPFRDLGIFQFLIRAENPRPAREPLWAGLPWMNGQVQ